MITWFNQYPIREDFINIWFPLLFPWIPVYIWLRPRVKLLRFKNETAHWGILFLSAVAISIPTMIAQRYLSTSSGKLTSLKNIHLFERNTPTKYYFLEEFYIDKVNIGTHPTTEVTGKYGGNFNMYIYLVLPIYQTVADTARGESTYWLMKKYHKTISNKLSKEEKTTQFEQFADQCQQEFDTTNFGSFSFLEKLGNTSERNELIKATEVSGLGDFSDPVIFEAHDERFEDRNGSKFIWIFISFFIGAILLFILLLFLKIHVPSVKKFKQGIKPEGNSLKEYIDLLIPKDGYFVTPIIAIVNILVFILMVFSGMGFISFQGTDLLQWGGNFRQSTIDGEWWRLVSSIFLHSGFMHLVANMVGLLLVGAFLEPLLGRLRFTLLYLATGVIASCSSIVWYEASVSVGASGAIFGLYGLFIAFMLMKVFPWEFSKVFLISSLFFVGFNLIMGLAGGIDNAAHIGGLVSGFLIGIIMAYTTYSQPEQEIN